MTKYVTIEELKVNPELVKFINDDVLPGLDISTEDYWRRFSQLVSRLAPINQALLNKRDALQKKIDVWNKEHINNFEFDEYKEFLTSIGYLLDEGSDFSISTSNVDIEITSQPGPQLVVPVSNARFCINAANARWGSLYDALYSTDVIADADGAERRTTYNPVRGKQVVHYAKAFLDEHFPLVLGKHDDVVAYSISDQTLIITLADQSITSLKNPKQLIGFNGNETAPSEILLVNNGLHVIITIDRLSTVGCVDSAGVKDIILESALTTIQDFEDSVVAVNAEEKLQVYKNWLGLMQGTLAETVSKNGKEFIRKLDEDKVFTQLNGNKLVLQGRSLMFCRNVGHLMTTPVILDKDDNEVPEGIVDAMVSCLISLHDLKGNSPFKNSKNGNIYIVKPKMHGPEEVAFANTLYSEVEDALELERNTIKLGIMDEERRTSINLKACIREVQSRVVFINTGFLDRTGDEIHTSMQLGPVVPKGEMKNQTWIDAYENNNVSVGLACGFQGKAQIGKGMWAIPDEMAAMMKNKIMHPKSGANTAWVPSPTAAVLHAIHYHKFDVFQQQNQIESQISSDIDSILVPPILPKNKQLSEEYIQRELENNAQGLLGYVVRWVDLGMGASKVPDINNVGLMEDRATLRISSQHICNWLLHGLLTKRQVMDTLKKMAELVDKQNANDPTYQPMSLDFDKSVAFAAAKSLIFDGISQPNGYTEPLLHTYRKIVNSQSN